MGSGLSYHSPAATLCVLPPAPSSFRSEEGGPRAGYKLKRRPGRGTSPGRKRALSPTLWAASWTIGATDFTNVNGLKRKVYGVGDYNISSLHQPTSDLAYTWVELTLPYAVVATGIEAVRRTDGATGTSSAYQSWNVSAATNNGWVDLNMDNSVFETAGNPAYYPTQFREITGNTVSSNRYRVFRGADEIGKYFDGFRIYSKDESPPAIPLGDVIESLIELNTFH